MEFMSTKSASRKPTTRVPAGRRGATVVNGVLKATGEELNAVGYAALRVEDVAERAGVNKTTIYRRWPTKDELVIDALRHVYEEQQFIPDTGDLREDMLQYIRHLIKQVKNPIPRGAMVTLHNCSDPAIMPIALELLGRARDTRVQIVKHAIERGELPATVDPEIISDLFSAPILRRLLTFGESVKPRYIEYVIDTVIAGAKAVASPRKTLKK
jgi:AcrR family transcriptional regulator